MAAAGVGWRARSARARGAAGPQGGPRRRDVGAALLREVLAASPRRRGAQLRVRSASRAAEIPQVRLIGSDPRARGVRSRKGSELFASGVPDLFAAGVPDRVGSRVGSRAAASLMVSPRRLRRGDSEARRETPAVKAGASGRWNPYRSAWARPSSRIIGPDGPADSALRCPARTRSRDRGQ